MEGKNLEEMTIGQAWTWGLSLLHGKGVTLFLLGLMAWYFQSQNDKLQIKVEACNSARIEYYEAKEQFMVTVFSENTQALNRIKEFMQDQNKK